MRAVYAEFPSSREPLTGLRYGDQPDATVPDADWTVISVSAASLNHHDLWNLRGAGLPAERYPLILGCDASGVDEDDQEVFIHCLMSSPEWRHDPVRDPEHSVLSDGAPGTFAERVAVPRYAVIPKPAWLSHEEACCLSGTWVTAYRMLFTKSGLRPGDTVLVQGASGGVATALIRLARAAGLRVWVTSRSAAKRDIATQRGAHAAYPPGRPLPEPVDAVMETVGQSTWSHSLRSVRPGGTIVVTGATSGGSPSAYLNRLFWQEIRVVGSTSGTMEEMRCLLKFMRLHDLRPDLDEVLPFAEAEKGFQKMLDGVVKGKIVFTW